MARIKNQVSKSSSSRNSASIIRLSNKNQVLKISAGMYYYVDMKTNKITFYDYRKDRKEYNFSSFKDFDKFVYKNIAKDYK